MTTRQKSAPAPEVLHLYKPKVRTEVEGERSPAVPHCYQFRLLGTVQQCLTLELQSFIDSFCKKEE